MGLSGASQGTLRGLSGFSQVSQGILSQGLRQTIERANELVSLTARGLMAAKSVGAVSVVIASRRSTIWEFDQLKQALREISAVHVHIDF